MTVGPRGRFETCPYLGFVGLLVELIRPSGADVEVLRYQIPALHVVAY